MPTTGPKHPCNERFRHLEIIIVTMRYKPQIHEMKQKAQLLISKI